MREGARGLCSPGLDDVRISVETAEEPALDFKNLIRRALWSLGLAFALLIALGLAFGKRLEALAVRAEETLGLAGLVLTVFAADSFTLPVPPDVALLVVAHGPRSEAWYWVVPLLGAVSMCGGLLSYGIGSRLAALPSVTRLRRVLAGRHAALVRRYGWGAVALGAVTPLPFSITCYAAGALSLPLKGFVLACALRIPRFLLYYAVFASAAGISR